jgi:hypothetical protein
LLPSQHYQERLQEDTSPSLSLFMMPPSPGYLPETKEGDDFRRGIGIGAKEGDDLRTHSRHAGVLKLK